jgi:hypothetical protein
VVERAMASAQPQRRKTAMKGVACLGALLGGAAKAGTTVVFCRLGGSRARGRAAVATRRRVSSRGDGGLALAGRDQVRRAAFRRCRRSRGAAPSRVGGGGERWRPKMETESRVVVGWLMTMSWSGLGMVE